MSDPTDKPAPAPRRIGRPTLALDTTIADAVIKNVANGVPNVHAFKAAGIAESTVYRWLDFGRDDPGHPGDEKTPPRPARKARSPFKEFRERFLRAEGQFIANHVNVINGAARGAETTTTSTVKHPDGRVETIVKVDRQPGDWRASAKLLAVRDPTHFSEKVVVENRHTGAGGSGPVLIGSHAETVAAMRGMSPEQLRAITGTDTSDLAPLPEGDGEEG